MTGCTDAGTVTFVAELVGVRRKGLTEFELVSRDCDHSAVVAVPEWSHGRFEMGERVCVTLSRLADHGEDARELTRPLLEWVEAHAGDLDNGHLAQLRALEFNMAERIGNELGWHGGMDAPLGPREPF